MRWKLNLFAASLVAGFGLSGSEIQAAAVNAPILGHAVIPDTTIGTPAAYRCWRIPGSGLGRQCAWVPDGPVWGGGGGWGGGRGGGGGGWGGGGGRWGGDVTGSVRPGGSGGGGMGGGGGGGGGRR